MGYVGLSVQVHGLAETDSAGAVAEKVRVALDPLFIGFMLHNVDMRTCSCSVARGGVGVSEHRTIVGPTVSWDCPSCGEHVTTSRIVGWDSLDAAWAEAEAALSGHPRWQCALRQWVNDEYAASADESEYHSPDEAEMVAFGSTPAAALRALAAKLREMA